MATQLSSHSSSPIYECLTLGGDTTLSYLQLLQRLQSALPPYDPATRCRFLSIPNRLFFLFSFFIFIFSPRYFEALLRVSADLSGFSRPSVILGIDSCDFPLTL